jgi:4-hydroxy-3-polyprenylbenzoate decarboxylase
MMADNSLASFISKLEQDRELIRIKEFISPDLMITEIADRFSKQPGGGKALLFENTGTGFPLLINALGSEKRIAAALGRNSLYEIENEIESLFSSLIQPRDNIWGKLKLFPCLKEVASWMPKRINRRGRCQEIVMDEPDLDRLPVLKCWPADGGKFITLPCVHTVDPDTGISNLGMYRMQVMGKNLTGMHWHRHKTGASHFSRYKSLNKKMPVSVTLGGNPVYTYAATAPMPENIDEYLLAGFLSKSPVRLVKCLTNELYVPEDADFVIEGFVDPSEELIMEGPFGDHTGFYSLADYYPAFHITCITHRRKAVYPATIVGVPPMEDAYIGKATGRIFLKPLRMTMVPELVDMDFPFAGVAHNLALISIQKKYPGQAIKVAHSLWGAGQMMFNKILIVVDEAVNIHDYSEMTEAFNKYFNPEYSLHFSRGPLDILDHSSQKFAFGSKLCIDITKPFPEEYESNPGLRQEKNEINRDTFSGIKEISGIKYLEENSGFPVLLLSVNKQIGFSRKKLELKLSAISSLSFLKLIILIDNEFIINDLNLLLWLIAGNIDPSRDISIIRFNEGGNSVLIDATVKSPEYDGFQRDWPNIVAMDDKIISEVDKKWKDLVPGSFIKSPSLRYKSLLKGSGAIRK